MDLACKEEGANTSKHGSSPEEEFECAVCLQTCVHPVKLPCSHIFCYLCVKGVANQSKRCAMCRQEIPSDFLDHPTLLKKLEEKETEAEGYQWFYEGRNGWWQYDERTSIELENSYANGSRLCEVLVAGFLYTIDFDRMIQHRRNDPSRRRRIKRDLSCIPKKGVAGLKSERNEVEPPAQDVSESTNEPTDDSVVTSSTDLTQSISSNIPRENEISNSDISSSISNLANHLHNIDISSFSRNANSRRHNLRSQRVGNNRSLPDSSGIGANITGNDLSHIAAADSSDLSHSTLPILHSDTHGKSSTTLPLSPNSSSSSSSPSTSEELSDIVTSTGEDDLTFIGREVQYYSLDDTEEYSLPQNDDEL